MIRYQLIDGVIRYYPDGVPAVPKGSDEQPSKATAKKNNKRKTK